MHQVPKKACQNRQPVCLSGYLTVLFDLTNEMIVYDRDAVSGLLEWNMAYSGTDTGLGNSSDTVFTSDGSRIIYTASDSYPLLGFAGIMKRFPESGKLEFVTRLFPESGNAVTPANPSAVLLFPMDEYLYIAAGNEPNGSENPMAAIYGPGVDTYVGQRFMASSVLFPCGLNTELPPWYEGEWRW